MRRPTWLILAAVVVVGWLALGFVPSTKTIPAGPGNDSYPKEPVRTMPVMLSIHCHGLLRSDPPTVVTSVSSFRSNPCLSGLAAKRVEWATILAALLTGCALAVVISRNRSQQRSAAAAAAPQPTPTNDHPG
jgi:hypothetical protein